MTAVTALIFHAPPSPGTGPRTAVLGEARSTLAELHRRRFLAAHAAAAELISEPPDDEPFGRRLGRALDRLPAARRGAGVVVVSSGALPLATAADYASFVAAASGSGRVALANNRFSCDAIAIPAVLNLPRPIDLVADNALPRWLTERAGYDIDDLRGRWRLQVDLDSPLDLILAARDRTLPASLRALAATELERPERKPLRRALADVERVLGDRSAELVVVGRTSATTLRWLETHARCRVRAIVEERGLRSAESVGSGGNARPPRSVVGRLLDLEGADSLARALAELGDAAVVDTRVLLAHRLGAGEGRWPGPEDRFASDLLDAPAIADPWLRAVTDSAASGGLPILLGGHSLVGPGLRLLATPGRRAPRLNTTWRPTRNDVPPRPRTASPARSPSSWSEFATRSGAPAP